ncbi:MAG TPA: C80 family cysteine peptidase, partial [Burkholderiales bacterium]|nr:C80 family cysteine peptidase [Burkholderiales bacterium]
QGWGPDNAPCFCRLPGETAEAQLRGLASFLPQALNAMDKPDLRIALIIGTGPIEQIRMLHGVPPAAMESGRRRRAEEAAEDRLSKRRRVDEPPSYSSAVMEEFLAPTWNLPGGRQDKPSGTLGGAGDAPPAGKPWRKPPSPSESDTALALPAKRVVVQLDDESYEEARRLSGKEGAAALWLQAPKDEPIDVDRLRNKIAPDAKILLVGHGGRHDGAPQGPIELFGGRPYNELAAQLLPLLAASRPAQINLVGCHTGSVASAAKSYAEHFASAILLSNSLETTIVGYMRAVLIQETGRKDAPYPLRSGESWKTRIQIEGGGIVGKTVQSKGKKLDQNHPGNPLKAKR